MKPGVEPVLKQPGDDLRQRAVVANVRFNVKRLQESTPILADMIKAGKLRVVGGFYDLPTGKVILV
jgi:carbonic anhydrase